jgi:hypothetical protein
MELYAIHPRMNWKGTAGRWLKGVKTEVESLRPALEHRIIRVARQYSS